MSCFFPCNFFREDFFLGMVRVHDNNSHDLDMNSPGDTFSSSCFGGKWEALAFGSMPCSVPPVILFPRVMLSEHVSTRQHTPRLLICWMLADLFVPVVSHQDKNKTSKRMTWQIFQRKIILVGCSGMFFSLVC